jgi:hypothetical protein
VVSERGPAVACSSVTLRNFGSGQGCPMEKKVPGSWGECCARREGRRIGLTAGIEAKFGDPSERTQRGSPL